MACLGKVGATTAPHFTLACHLGGQLCPNFSRVIKAASVMELQRLEERCKTMNDRESERRKGTKNRVTVGKLYGS